MPVEVMDGLPDEAPVGSPKVKVKPQAKSKPKPPQVMAQDKPGVYFDGDLLVIRASALGGCLGNLTRQGLGQTPSPPPDFMQAKYDEGHEAEPIILDWVRGKSWGIFDDWELEDRYGELHDGQARIEIRAGSDIVVRQHFDGFCRDAERNEYCLEAKAWTVGTREAFESKVEFVDGSVVVPASMRSSYIAYQISCAIIGSKMPCLLVIGQKVKQDDSYEGPVEIEDYFTYVVEEPPFSRGEVIARAMKVRELIDEGKPPPCDIRQFPCGFWQDHDEAEGVWAKGVPVDVGTLDVEEALFDSLAGTYKAAHEMVKQWEAKKKAAKKGLDAAYEGVDEPEVESADFKVKRINQTTKGGIDWEAAAKSKGVTDKDAEKFRKPSYDKSWYEVDVKDD